MRAHLLLLLWEEGACKGLCEEGVQVMQGGVPLPLRGVPSHQVRQLRVQPPQLPCIPERRVSGERKGSWRFQSRPKWQTT